jgi:hypothetical protein
MVEPQDKIIASKNRQRYYIDLKLAKVNMNTRSHGVAGIRVNVKKGGVL